MGSASAPRWLSGDVLRFSFPCHFLGPFRLHQSAVSQFVFCGHDHIAPISFREFDQFPYAFKIVRGVQNVQMDAFGHAESQVPMKLAKNIRDFIAFVAGKFFPQRNQQSRESSGLALPIFMLASGVVRSSAFRRAQLLERGLEQFFKACGAD